MMKGGGALGLIELFSQLQTLLPQGSFLLYILDSASKHLYKMPHLSTLIQLGDGPGANIRVKFLVTVERQLPKVRELFGRDQVMTLSRIRAAYCGHRHVGSYQFSKTAVGKTLAGTTKQRDSYRTKYD